MGRARLILLLLVAFACCLFFLFFFCLLLLVLSLHRPSCSMYAAVFFLPSSLTTLVTLKVCCFFSTHLYVLCPFSSSLDSSLRSLHTFMIKKKNSFIFLGHKVWFCAQTLISLPLKDHIPYLSREGRSSNICCSTTWIPFTGAQTNTYFNRRQLSIQERWSKKQTLHF